MAGRKRETATEEQAVVGPQPAVSSAPAPFAFEPLDAETRSRLNVVGNALKIGADQLRAGKPEWARFLDDMFEVLGTLVQEHKEA